MPVAPADAATTWPIETAKRLPSHGVVVYVSMTGEVDDAEVYTPRSLPLRLADGHFLSSSYGNQPAPHVSETIITARVGDDFLFAVVWFGTPTPNERHRRVAEAQLARIVVPAE